MQRRDERPGPLRLGHGCCEPHVLWLDGEWLEPHELALSEGLRADLLAWQQYIQDHLVETRSWDDPACRAEFRRQGQDLHRRLETELGERVVLDLSEQRVGW